MGRVPGRADKRVIGRATAHALARDGANVVLAARRRERLESAADALQSEHGAETLAVTTDVREQAQVEELVAATVERFGGIDVLVNNAGLARGSEVEDLSTEEYRAMQEVNVDGTFFATRAALPHLRESEGNLVFVGNFAERFEPGSVTEPEEVAEAIAFAARQRHSTVNELDLYRRDKFSHF